MSSDDGFSHLESDLLRSFLAVARAGSISGGAHRLLRTQSAISLRVQKLEDIVGQQLFERRGRGVLLTARGEQLLPIARQVIETLDQTVSLMREAPARREVRLGIPEEYGDTLLPSILSGFSEERPGARILLRCGSSVDFPASLAAGELDVAVHTPEIVTMQDLVVHRETAVWTGSVFHDVQSRRPLPVALFDKACWWRERCLDLLQRAGLNYEIVCTSESVAGVRAAISAGIAVGVLPQSALTSRIRQLPDADLPVLGETPLVLTRSSTAPKELADSLAAVVLRAVRMMEAARQP